MKIECIQNLIDILRGKKETCAQKKLNMMLTNLKYSQKINSIKKRLKDKTSKIRVGFLVVFDSVFPLEPLFRKMMDDEIFEPFIIVIPDITRGDDNMFYQLNKTYKTLSNKYENIILSYNKKTGKFVDFSSKMDIACFANPYENLTHKFYTIKWAYSKNILPVYASYTLITSNYLVNTIINLYSLNLCWKVFADTEYNLEEFKKYTDRKGMNVHLTGYIKMDSLSEIKAKLKNRKKIIIAPHHSVTMTKFPLSNFLTYADFFLELPQKYPEIDFVFRPHPILYTTLERDNVWGKEKTKNYFEKMSNMPNVEYQNGGDYFDTFVNSDGIIHDCSSFLAEYLYVGKPACYMFKQDNKNNELYTELGQKCLEQYYKAFNKEDIIKFINDVIINGNDEKKFARNKFAHEHLMVNYPHVANEILKIIKTEFI